MKRLVLFALVIACLLSVIHPVRAHNPFTSKPKTGQKVPQPVIKSPVFAQIIVWQHQLKRKMSTLIRQGENGGGTKPLVLLMGIAFLYGAIHAAGPGHGKVVAMSYMLSHRATIRGGMLFGTSFALIHAASGVVGVLGLRYIIRQSVSDTLVSVTSITQIISFGLITLLGLGILVRHGRAVFSASMPAESDQPAGENQKSAIPWAVAAGLVPCPAVVMVMLFCLSMDVLMLGLLLSACISIGMATTLTGVAVIVVTGKTGVLKIVSEKAINKAECIIGSLSGTAIFIFGVIFLLTAIHSAQF